MNIIVIVSDTCRQDHLGCYGNDWMHTESLDKLASESVIFDNCYLGSFPTLPHRAECFLGRYGFPFYGWCPLPDDWPAMAEMLSDNGYVTQLIHDTPHLATGDHFYSRGFQGHHWNRGQERDCQFTRVNDDPDMEWSLEKDRYSDYANYVNHTLQRKFYPGEMGCHSARTALDACRWLEHNYKADNFFLWIDMFDPHEPWDPPDWFTEMYFPGEFDGEKIRHPDYNYTDYLTEDELNWCHAAYCGELTLVDKWIGVLLEKVSELDLLGETLVIFTADHGFYLGEHGRIGKAGPGADPWPLYEEIAAQPLLVRIPDGPRGVRQDQIVQPPDLLPTALDLCGVEADLNHVHGKSFRAALNGSNEPHRDIAISTRRIGDRSDIGSRVTVTSKDRWSLILGTKKHEPQLFYLPDDPQQENDVYQEHEKEAERIAARFRKVLGELGMEEDRVAQWTL